MHQLQDTPRHSTGEPGAEAAAPQPHPVEVRRAVWHDPFQQPYPQQSAGSNSSREITRTNRLGSHRLRTRAIDQQILMGSDTEVQALTFGSPDNNHSAATQGCPATIRSRAARRENRKVKHRRIGALLCARAP